MTTVTNTYRVVINARPEAVFTYVSDLTRHPNGVGAALGLKPFLQAPSLSAASTAPTVTCRGKKIGLTNSA